MSERIDWQAGKPREVILEYLPWREAVERADEGDHMPLVQLMRSDAKLGPDARDLVADLLSRHRLTKRKGGQKQPAYRVTLAEGKLRKRVSLVRYFRGKGLSAEDAVLAALRDEKREALEMDGNELAYAYSDEEIDGMIPDVDIDILENRVRRGGRPR